MARAAGENFPVASGCCPAAVRAHMLAVYGFARLVDELGDSRAGDRLAALDWLQRELQRAYEGPPEHPLMQRLAVTVRECALPREPFERLIEANRVDQRVSRYETWQQLRGYCALSADPVGEIVLESSARRRPRGSRCRTRSARAAAGRALPGRRRGLRRGRVYLPAEDLARFGATTAELAPRAMRDDPALRAVVAFEVERAHALLDDGAPLVGELRGRERLAVAAFVAGGRAALRAIERARYDVLAGPPRASSRRRLRALIGVLYSQRGDGATGVAPRRS